MKKLKIIDINNTEAVILAKAEIQAYEKSLDENYEAPQLTQFITNLNMTRQIVVIGEDVYPFAIYDTTECKYIFLVGSESERPLSEVTSAIDAYENGKIRKTTQDEDFYGIIAKQDRYMMVKGEYYIFN